MWKKDITIPEKLSFHHQFFFLFLLLLFFFSPKIFSSQRAKFWISSYHKFLQINLNWSLSFKKWHIKSIKRQSVPFLKKNVSRKHNSPVPFELVLVFFYQFLFTVFIIRCFWFTLQARIFTFFTVWRICVNYFVVLAIFRMEQIFFSLKPRRKLKTTLFSFQIV